MQVFGIAVRAGHRCAMPLIERFGVPATCRACHRRSTTRMQMLIHSRGLLLRSMNCSHIRAVVPQATTDGSVASPHQYVKSISVWSLPAQLRRFFGATKNEGTRAGGQWRSIGRCERHANPIAMLELSRSSLPSRVFNPQVVLAVMRRAGSRPVFALATVGAKTVAAILRPNRPNRKRGLRPSCPST